MKFVKYLCTFFLLAMSNVVVPSDKQSVQDLNTNWEFYWNKTYTDLADVAPKKNVDKIRVPGYWIQNGNPALGYATYRLTLDNLNPKVLKAFKVNGISSAYNLYVNKKKIGSLGKFGISQSSCKELTGRKVFPFTHQSNHIEILIEVCNFSDKSGGFWDSIEIGSYERINREYQINLFLDYLLFGILIVMACYHFILYFYQGKVLSTFFFALFSLFMAFRKLLTGENVIYHLLGESYWNLSYRLEYLTLYLALSAFILYFSKLYERDINKKYLKFFSALMILLLAYIILMPVKYFHYSLYLFHILTLTTAMYIVSKLFYLLRKKRKEVKFMLFGFTALALGVLHDLLAYNGFIVTPFANMIFAGIILFYFSQSILISKRYVLAFTLKNKMAKEVIRIRNASARFIPLEIFSLLKQKSILQVKLGDFIEKKMTIMFLHLSYTKGSKTGAILEEDLVTLNSLLATIGPEIRKHNGFIDKYIGSSIMILFPYSSDDGLNCATKINHLLAELHFETTAVDTHIGLHCGNVTFGIIGEEQRLQCTVLGDSVNLASRISHLTTRFGAKILTTFDTIESLSYNTTLDFRFLGKISVKGKENLVELVEILDADSENLQKEKSEFKEIFEQAVSLYIEKNYDQAEEIFLQLKEVHAHDVAIQFYLDRLTLHKQEALDEVLL